MKKKSTRERTAQIPFHDLSYELAPCLVTSLT